MTIYDQLGISYVQHPLHKGKVTIAAFISYAFSNTIGLFLLTAGSIRYRLYSAWGLSTEEIARLVSFTTLTFWLGLATVGGLVLIAAPLKMSAMGGLIGIYSIRPIGLGLLILAAGYLLIVLIRKAPFRIWNWGPPTPIHSSGRCTVSSRFLRLVPCRLRTFCSVAGAIQLYFFSVPRHLYPGPDGCPDQQCPWWAGRF